jgi:hypothetical protein
MTRMADADSIDELSCDSFLRTNIQWVGPSSSTEVSVTSPDEDCRSGCVDFLLNQIGFENQDCPDDEPGRPVEQLSHVDIVRKIQYRPDFLAYTELREQGISKRGHFICQTNNSPRIRDKESIFDIMISGQEIDCTP